MSAKMESLKRMLCRELDEVAMKGELNMGDLEIVHKITDTIKNIDKISMLEDGQYSNTGDWRASGNSYRNSYNDGYVQRRGRYSMAADPKMVEYLRAMLNKNIDQREREAVEWALQELDR